MVKFLFVANDIAKGLGYKNPSDATTTHCKYSIIRWGSDSLGRQQRFKFISESDVYRLIFKSKLKEAKEFENWVFKEVILSIRKVGAYIEFNGKQLSNEEVMKLLKDYKDKNDLFLNSDKCVLIGDFANMLKWKDEFKDIGRNKLFRWLRYKKILTKDNKPMSNYAGKYFKVIYDLLHDNKYCSSVTFITLEGMEYISNRLYKEGFLKQNI